MLLAVIGVAITGVAGLLLGRSMRSDRAHETRMHEKAYRNREATANARRLRNGETTE